jgi:hypothetical protein
MYLHRLVFFILKDAYDQIVSNLTTVCFYAGDLTKVELNNLSVTCL